MSNTRGDWIQFGCGLCAPSEWTNFDGSPTLRLQRMPLLGRLMPAGPFGRFPDNVRYGDIVKGLPARPHSVELLYCSHVLEHLSLEDLRTAIRNCLTLLRPGGVFRLVLPDLERLVKAYIANNSSEAALKFVDHLLLGRRVRPRGLSAMLRDGMSNSHHLWMWDFKALSKELSDVGFCGIRQADYLDSPIEAFRLVEEESRWKDSLGIECRAPG